MSQAQDDRTTTISTTVAPQAVPRVATLDGFVEAATASSGVSLNDIDPLTVLHVETHNSLYRIIVSMRTDVLVEGGKFFPTLTRARLAGSTFGGSMLKMAWIGIGMHMEICGDDGPIVTSPVRCISVEQPQTDLATHRASQ